MTISVRALVEFLTRSGDLDNRTGGAPEGVMQEGSRMHRQIQKSAGEGYLAEVPLSITWNFDSEGGEQTPELAVTVEGRADGVYYGRNLEADPLSTKRRRKGQKGKRSTDDGSYWTIDEIKTTYRRISRLHRPEPVHLAQAKCYAYIYAVQHDLARVNVRMTYCNLLSNDIRYFYEEETLDGLEAWFTALMEEYRKWVAFEIAWGRKRTDSIWGLTFPFSYREGQKELVSGVYHTIAQGKKLFLEAPTGTGKTITTLYPSLKVMGDGRAEKIFYLTAKTITRTAATDAIELLRHRGLQIKSVVLTSKEKICVLEKPACNPEQCPRARGHFDHINEALFDLLTHEDNFTREVIEAYAAKYEVCPFEMGLDMSSFSDVIIGDYNYLFDPHAYLRRFFGGGDSKGAYIFLVDEAHNLVERGRDMYSAELVKEDLLRMKKRLKNIYPGVASKIEKANRAMLSLKRRYEEWGGTGCMELPEIDQLSQSAYDVQSQLEETLMQERIAEQNGGAARDPLFREKKEVRDELLDFYFGIAHFTLILQRKDEHYVTYAEKAEKKGEFRVRMFCVDPSRNLKACMDRGMASILFSATFLPIQYYKALLGGTADDYEIYAHSVFDPKKRGLFIVRDVTSRYRQRGPEEYARIADCIHNVTGQRHGNYLVFCPSYSFLESVADVFEEKYLGRKPAAISESGMPSMTDAGGGTAARQERQLAVRSEENVRLERFPLLTGAKDDSVPAAAEDGSVPAAEITVLRQSSHMDETAREEFLSQFQKARDDHSVIGFCVLGGIFGEGIDLKKDCLIGALIIGTGLPKVTGERELLKTYFERNERDGFAYAYRYPGMNKVLQASGRVIRTADDVGIVALLDERFQEPSYRQLFPAEWANAQIISTGQAAGLVEKFWDEWL